MDGAGRVIAQINALGQTTRYEYDALNQLLNITDPLGGRTSFSYDPNGNLQTVTDAVQNQMPLPKQTVYTYNNMDRLETRTDPLGNVEMYQYDLAGNLKQFTDRRRKVTIFGYDALNRRYFAGFGTIFGPPDTYESTISYGYDGLNRLTQADVAVPLFDTTLLHSQMAVDFILGKQGLAHVRTIQ